MDKALFHIASFGNKRIYEEKVRMKILYFLKKGFQFYPPCLAQILMLSDLGADLVVYHGINSEYIDNLLDSRNIEHHLLESDSLKNSKIQSVKKIFSYKSEVKRIIKELPQSAVLWFGNCESFMTLGNSLNGRRFVASVLELYDDQKWIDLLLMQILPKASLVICCERHRAAIMKSRYKLKTTPAVMPNKAYDLSDENGEEDAIDNIDTSVLEAVQRYKNSRIVLYQGIIGRDRPLANIARALAMIDDPDVVFWIMGKGDIQLVDEVKEIYHRTVYLGFVPSPQHMLVTRHAHIGIANYDYSNLNNIFCAPNKIYEYAKFGMPMLTSDNIGLTETVGAAGAAECVDFSDVTEVKNGLEKILCSYDKYHKNAMEFYKQTDNQNIMNRIYKELLEI